MTILPGRRGGEQRSSEDIRSGSHSVQATETLPMAQRWQALDDCVMLLEVLRCAPYVAGCPDLESTWNAYVTCRVFVLLVFTARLQAVLLAMDICKMLCGREAP